MIVRNTQKKIAKTSKLNDLRKTLIETTNRFSILLPDKNPTDSSGKDNSERYRYLYR